MSLPEFNLEIETVEIRAITRRLRFAWTMEAQVNLMQFHDVGTALDLLGELFDDGPVVDYDWRIEGF